VNTQTLEALRLYRAYRQLGPAFWSDFSPGQTVVGQLEALGADTRGAWARAARTPTPSGPPWTHGIVGWFGYEAARDFERAPDPAGPRLLPDAWWGRVASAAVVDGAGRLRHQRGGAPPPAAFAPARPTDPDLHVEEPDDAGFLAGVDRVLAHLRAGDCYQVNLSRREVVRGRLDPLATWLRLRERNPARRAVLIETDEGAVVSNSPELLLRARGGRVLSVPIKGTARVEEPREGLLRSRKERAELTMIVDLVRSDLGRVAVPGSVQAGPRRVGRVGHLWHAMQRVEATLEAGHDAVDAFSALFPPGSVTGAPRVRAMEVIRALEPVPRGVYCGSIGWFAPGEADVNVAIRTISFRGEVAHVQAGSGIVLDSVPERELAEARLKGERLRAAL
jgi:anthranilate/para-aminobenzoate synthase component I